MLNKPTAGLKKENRLERGQYYRKPSITSKDVKSRFTPGARQMPKTSQIVVRNESTLNKALELAADVGAVIVEVEGIKYHLEGPKMLKDLQKIVEDELAENRGAIVSHWRGREGYMSSEVTTAFTGRTAPNRMTVSDQNTYTTAMNTVRMGPVRIFSARKSYVITRPEQLQQILQERLDKKRTIDVAPYEPPKQVANVTPAREPTFSGKALPTANVSEDYVVFRDEEGLKRAFQVLKKHLGNEPKDAMFKISSGKVTEWVNTYPEALTALSELAQPGKIVIVKRWV
jgi:hypothetical protein